MEQTKKYEIKAFSTTNLKKDGTEIKSKFGKTQWRTTVQVPEHGQQWITGFLPFQPDWKAATKDANGKEIPGDFKELIIYESEYNGQKQLNFKLPNKEDKLGKLLEEIANRQSKQHLEVLNALREIYKVLKPTTSKVAGTDIDYPEMTEEPNFDVVEEEENLFDGK